MMKDETNAPRSPFRADQPWGDPQLARLYDAFPFDDDLPLYLELAASQGGRVLEVGCGTGRVLVPLLEAGFSVVGVDASPHMLALAHQKLAVAGQDAAERAQLVYGDVRSFVADGAFGLAIVAVKSLAYLVRRADQQQALTNIARHLRPRGLLVLDLLHPSPAWLNEPPGNVRQDVVGFINKTGETVVRTETMVSTDLARQVRIVRSVYDVIASDGSVTKRLIEWPYRYVHRFEAELLLERAGFQIEALYGGYRREPFTSDSRVMLFLARLPGAER